MIIVFRLNKDNEKEQSFDEDIVNMGDFAMDPDLQAELNKDKEAMGDYIVDNKITESSINSLRKYIEEL